MYVLRNGYRDDSCRAMDSSSDYWTPFDRINGSSSPLYTEELTSGKKGKVKRVFACFTSKSCVGHIQHTDYYIRNMETATFLSSAKEKASRKQARTGKHWQTLLSESVAGTIKPHGQPRQEHVLCAILCRDKHIIPSHMQFALTLQRRKLQYGAP